MGYQSKTYSLSDEVVQAIEAKRAEGVTPDQYLWSLIFKTVKLSKKQKALADLAASDVTAQAVGREDIEYGSHETTPRGQHVVNSDWRAGRKPLTKPSEQKK